MLYYPHKMSERNILMSDNLNNESPEEYGDVKIKSPFLENLENFFYHYKWHTLIALFLVFTISICSFQMCSKTSYDLYIMYAGGTSIPLTPYENEADSRHVQLLSATKRFVCDYDDDGNRNVNLLNLYIPSSEQISEIESAKDGTVVDYSLLAKQKDTFNQYMFYGDYYIVMISEELYDGLISNENNNPLAPISSLLPENAEEANYRLAGDFGVYLSSTPLWDNPGFSNLDEDTILCIRRYSSIGKNKKDTEFYAHNENVFRLMLQDKAYS